MCRGTSSAQQTKWEERKEEKKNTEENESRERGEKTLRKLSLRLDMRIYNWAEEYGTTVSEYLEHAVYSALEFGGTGFQFELVRVVPKYDTSVYLTDRTFKEVKKLAKQNNLSKAQILNRSAIMFHVKHIHDVEREEMESEQWHDDRLCKTPY